MTLPTQYFAFLGISPAVWLVLLILIVVGLYYYFNKRETFRSVERTLLVLEIPRANDKKELAAEQMFASLHGILRNKKELAQDSMMQEHLSFEVAAIDNHIRFFVSVPTHLRNFVEGQIYAQYPTVQIYEAQEDYAKRDLSQKITHTAELSLIDNDVLPIKTFQSFEVDPLAAITATLAKLEDKDEEMWIQILARPINDNWHKKSSKFVSKIRNNANIAGLSTISAFFTILAKPPEGSTSSSADISERDKTRINAIEEKSVKLGYRVKVRVVYLGNDKVNARLRMQAMLGTFKQFNTTNLNGFTQTKADFSDKAISEYSARLFIDNGFILNIEELASLFHLPHTNVETPNILWATSKTAEPPVNLPLVENTQSQELSPFGVTNFRGTNLQFGIKRSDRGRHLYIVGQTGVGKSGLLELLTLSDVYGNEGFAIIDPHGDYAANILKYIPEHRIDDVVYFNPADTEFPIGFNPMEVNDTSLKTHISSELVGVLKRMFDSWGPRLEYILRYTILALLDYPDSTMLDITRMLTDKSFRKDVIHHIKDPVVKNFWVNEFGSWNDKFATEAVAPVLNKVGAFVANPIIRNIVGQPKSSMNIRSIMDNGKILIVNLSRGLLGEDNAAIMGALMVTKIQLAAMSRADIASIEDRRPFYLYVDEFQNFATDSFAVILSEARKYGLNLTVANQYVSQMNPMVKDAIFGNVGSIVSFRVGADDASILQKYFEPQFESQDLIQLHNRHMIIAMSIDGEKTPAFSATTLNIPKNHTDYFVQIVEHSRKRYASLKTEVEQYINTESLLEIEQNTNKNNSSNKSKKLRKSKNKSKSEKSDDKSKKDHKSKSAGNLKDDTTIKLR